MHRPQPPISNRFRFHPLDNGWTVGRFSALGDLDVPHLVSTFNGPDVQKIKEQTYRAGRQVAQVLGGHDVALLSQVHGGKALACRERGLIGAADALCTGKPGLVLVGKSADCPIILVADRDQRAVGFAHASWRSTVAGITGNLVSLMTERFSCQPENLLACICPSAGPECYEVGPEVRESAIDHIGAHAAAFFKPGPEKEHFDLWAANEDALVRSGLAPDCIHSAGVCTICENGRFPSYRAEGSRAGRFLAAIAIR
jgi:polyphenol oxidase